MIIALIFLYKLLFTLMESPSCFLSGGNWDGYSSSCMDQCGLPENSICLAVMSTGCNCGLYKCWDYEKQRCVMDKDIFKRN